MALEPVEPVHSVNILRVEAGKEAAVADALAKIIRNYTREQILERLGRPPWTITRKASAKIASRLVKLLEPLGALLRVDPPLPSAETTPVMPEPIVPARGGSMPQVQPRRDVAYPFPGPTVRSGTLPPRTPEPMPESAWSIEPLSLGGILDRSFNICKAHWWKLLAIAAIPWAVMALTGLLIGAAAKPLALAGANPGAFDPSTIASKVGVFLGALLIGGSVLFVCTCLLEGALTYAVSRIYLGRPLEMKDTFSFVHKKLAALVLTSLLVLVIWTALWVGPVMVGALLFVLVAATGISGWWTAITWIPLAIVPLYCIPKTTLYDKAIILEDRAYMDSINRSWNLMTGKGEGEWPRGYWLKLVVIWHVVILIIIAIHMVVGLPVGIVTHFLSGPSLTVAEVFNFFLQQGGGLIGQLFGYVCLVVFYYDIRCRKEGFDLEMLSGLVEEP
ncbi:MAG: hypothetical protein AB1646_11430 [Thermodesulfobacteriota bacterium]